MSIHNPVTVVNTGINPVTVIGSDGVVDPAMEGAIGDGVTIDTDAVKSAITKAGIGGMVVFTPGKTYIIDAVLTPLTGQTWLGDGAKLKRIDKVATTFAVSESSGSANPVIEVADASGFRVNQSISFYTVGWTGSTEAANQEQGAYIITDITGNLITTNGPTLANSYAIGDHVITSTRIISSDSTTDVSIIGLEIDGNRSSYASTFNFWVNHAEIRLVGHRSLITRCYLHDSLCEAVYTGGDGTVVDRCRFINTGGNGIHLSTGYGGTVTACYFESNNMGDSTAHQDGAVSLSLNVDNWTLVNSSCDGQSSTLALIGGLDESTTNITVDTCRVKDTVNNAIDFAGEYTTSDVDTIKIINCHLDNAGDIHLSNSTGSFRIKNATVSGNTILQGQVNLQRVKDSKIFNNTVDNTGDATRQCYNLNITEDIDLDNNKSIEGSWGIGLNSGGCVNTNLSGNTITNPQVRGISLISAGSGTVVDGNKVNCTEGVAGSGHTAYYTQEANSIFTNNKLRSNATTGFNIAMDITATADGADIVGNTFVNPATEGGAYVRAGAVTVNMINNTVSVATNDAGTTTNIVNEQVLA